MENYTLFLKLVKLINGYHSLGQSFICTTNIMAIDMKYKRWLLPVLVGLLLFGNHYTRDSLGALEKQFEHEYNFSDQEYANINSLYFFPNMITPLLAGMLTEKFGGVSICFLYSVIVASIGHFFFALGIQFKSKFLIFCGRGLAGSMYEIVDAFMPITYLSPLFSKEFQLVVGFMQIFIRMGSVANFIISPYLYLHYGVKTAFWVASLIGIASVPLFLLSRQIESEYIQYQLNEELMQQIKSGTALPTAKEVEMTSVKSSDSINTATTSSTFTITDDEEVSEGGDKSKQQQQSEEDDSTTVVFNPLADDSVHGGTFHTKTATSNKNNNSNSILSIFSSWENFKSSFLSVMPLDKFSYRFYMYLYCGSLLYGAIVPFWFTGSKYMQDHLYINVAAADTLVSIPEMMVIVVGFPIGIIVTKYQWTLPFKLGGVCISMLGMSLAYTLLIAAAYSSGSSYSESAMALATFAVLLLGISFSFGCQLFWGAINDVVGAAEHNSAGSGLVCCGVNILPTIVPPLLTLVTDSGSESERGSSNVNIIVLGVMSFMSAIFALLSAYPTYVEALMTAVYSSNYNKTNSSSVVVVESGSKAGRYAKLESGDVDSSA